MLFLSVVLSVGVSSAQQTQPPAPAKQAEQEDETTSSNTTESLQKATQNPIASLISVPLENYTNFGIGPTANWRAKSGNVWTVPFGAGVGRIMKLGFQPVNLQAEFFGNAAYPSNASTWTVKGEIAFLFPKLSTKEKELLMEEKLKEMQKESQK